MEEQTRDTDKWVTITCPECGCKGKVPEWWKKFDEVECKECDERFTFDTDK